MPRSRPRSRRHHSRRSFRRSRSKARRSSSARFRGDMEISISDLLRHNDDLDMEDLEDLLPTDGMLDEGEEEAILLSLLADGELIQKQPEYETWWKIRWLWVNADVAYLAFYFNEFQPTTSNHGNHRKALRNLHLHKEFFGTLLDDFKDHTMEEAEQELRRITRSIPPDIAKQWHKVLQERAARIKNTAREVHASKFKAQSTLTAGPLQSAGLPVKTRYETLLKLRWLLKQMKNSQAIYYYLNRYKPIHQKRENRIDAYKRFLGDSLKEYTQHTVEDVQSELDSLETSYDVGTVYQEFAKNIASLVADAHSAWQNFGKRKTRDQLLA